MSLNLPPPEKSPDLFSSSESEDHSMTPPPARCSPPPVSPRHAINSPPLHIHQFPQQFVTPYSAYPVSPRHAMPLESLPPPLPPPRSYQPIQKQFVTLLRYSAHPVSPRHAMPLESSPPPLPPPRSYQPIQKQFVTPLRYSAHPVSPRHAMPLESSPPPLPPPRSYQPIQKQFVTPISVNPRVPMEPIHSIYGPHLTEPSHQMVCSYNE